MPATYLKSVSPLIIPPPPIHLDTFFRAGLTPRWKGLTWSRKLVK